MLRKLNSPQLLFSEIRVRYLHQIFCFLYYGMGQPTFSHFGHNHGKEHVGLFLLYSTCLPPHRCVHDENLPEIRCCCNIWNLAITSTLYSFVTPMKVFRAAFVHCQGRLSWISSGKMPVLIASLGSISTTIQQNLMFNCGDFPLRAAI
jgi:hypothetical protein